MNRKIGNNFDKKKADEIFDAVEKLKENKIPQNLKNQMNNSKNISQLLKQAKNRDEETAIKIYEKILTINPENYESYEELSKIYQNNNDFENEKKILKNAVKNINGSKKEKFIKRLQMINH